MAWGLVAVEFIVAGLVSNTIERLDPGSVMSMFFVILAAALPFHLLIEIAEHLIANREKERAARPKITKADAMAATHLAANMGARLRSKR